MFEVLKLLKIEKGGCNEMHSLWLLALDHDIHEVPKTNLVCCLSYFISLTDLDTWWQRYT